MDDERKKFKHNKSAFNVSIEDPVPEQLKHCLTIIAQSFHSSHMRNLDILTDNKDRRIYGLITHYEGNNICWVQPTVVKNDRPERNYDLYVKKINNKKTELKPFLRIEVGLDCVAKYEVDKNWYRGVVIQESEGGAVWKVLFIDYGNVQTCYSDQIRQPYRSVSCDHFHAPQQAICCRLYNIIPQLPSQQKRIDTHLSSWSTQNCNTFLEIKVKDIRPDYVIDCDLFISPKTDVVVIDENANESEDLNRLLHKHIGQDLVNQGVAKFVNLKAAHAIKLAPPSSEPANFGASACDIKVETKFDANSKTKPDIKCEVKPDIKPDIKFEVKPDIKIEVTTDIKSKVEIDVKPDVKSDFRMMEECKPDVKFKLEIP